MLSWPSDIRWKGVGLASLAVLPWVMAADDALAWVWLARLAFTIACLAGLYNLLRDPARTAALLRRGGDSGHGQHLHIGVERLMVKLAALEHRWVQRHAITGLPIRESLLERIAAALSEADGPVVVGAIRFADYKRLAAFDPDAAESALKIFAERLSASLAEDRLLAHVDRDCFAILFPAGRAEVTKREFAVLCYALGAEIELDGLAFVPEIEGGTALAPDEADTAAGTLNQALLSLARVGRSAAMAPSGGESAEEARERFTIQQGLRLAIDRQELELHFQPVVDVSKGLLVGAEALLRWRHPQIGLVGPARFIPILEDSDLTREIGLWVLNNACREARRWRDDGLGELSMALNFSARQLRDADLATVVERTLRRHQLPPEVLEIELTETAAAEDADTTRMLFGALRNLGVRIAIDDFGSGYSSLSYLKNLPFDKLKIDREFVCDVHLRRDSQAICRSLVELSRGLGIAILAEGVEKLEEVETLERLGCAMFQGFYFSRPLPAVDFVNYARHRPLREDADVRPVREAFRKRTA